MDIWDILKLIGLSIAGVVGLALVMLAVASPAILIVWMLLHFLT